MAIPNYQPPQLNVEQVLDISTPTTPAPQLAVVVGPRYLLSRYGKESDTPSVDFVAAGQDIAWKYNADGVETALPSDDVVDLDSAKLYGKSLEASLAHYTSITTPKFYLNSLATPNVIKTAGGGNLKGTLDSLLHDREVKVGDIVYVNDGVSGTRRRSVTALQGVDIDAHFGSNNDYDDENFANSSYNPITGSASLSVVSAESGVTLTVVSIGLFNGLLAGAKYNGSYGEKFTLTCRTAGAPATATFDVSSESGLYSATNVPTTDSSGNYRISSADAGGALAGITVQLAGSYTAAQGDEFVFIVYGAYARLSTTQIDGDDTGSGYTGTLNTVYAITVTTGTASGVTGGVVQITSSNGVDPTTNVTLTANTFFNVGAYGVKAKFNYTSAPTQGGLRKGDVYYVHAYAPSKSTTEFDKAVLNGPASDTSLFTDTATPIDVEFRLAFSGNIPADEGPDGSPAWQATADALEVNDALSLYVAARASGYQWVNYVDDVGTLWPSFRALIPAESSQTLISIEDTSDITSQIGTIDLDNPLAYGAARALAGAGGLIYALPVGGLTSDDFVTALALISARDDAAALVALTNDLEVMEVFKTHVAAMSSKTLMHWRRAYVGSDSPGRYPVLKLQDDDTPYTATVGESGGDNILLTVETEDVDFETLDIDPGDIVIIPSEDAEYVVDEVISPTELMLVTGPATTISPGVPFQIWKANTARSQATFIINRSRALGSRRVVHVWQENGTTEVDGVQTIIPNMFIAAEMAGIRTAVLPQQGLSRRAVSTIAACPAMYSRYSDDLLNEIASNGTCLITQDVEGGEVYIRHQLTTDPNDGILYYEDSVGWNVDNVCFGIKALIKGYIGRYNVNRRSINAIQAGLNTYLQGLTSTDVTVVIGPQLNGVARVSVTVPTAAPDTINADVQAYVPVPLNKVLVTFQASIDPTTGNITTTATV